MAIASVLTSVGAVIAKGITALAGTVASLSAKTLAAKFIYGGIMAATSAISAKIFASSKSGVASSPSYQSMQYTQTNPDLPLPIIYGTVKVAGNLLWQCEANENYSQRIVAFSEGEITAFEDIRLNDIPVTSLQMTNVEKYYGTSDQTVSNIVPGLSQAEKIQKVGSLKNVAYLAITTLVTEKTGSSYNLTTVIKGKKVRVYNSVNTYTIKYSENPAWILFDFLTSYNGLGLTLNDNSEIDENMISEIFDMQSFLESASYCDELVFGKPRFTFNMIFDSQTSVRNLLDEIYRSCRGGLFFKNGMLQFKIDKAEPVSKVFHKNDIANEVFNAVSSEELSDIFKCVYISPEHEWQKVEAFAEIPEYRNGIPVENTVNIYSCTNFEQASRLAWYYANSKVLQPYYGSFQTDFRAYDLEVGDVIRFDSLLMGVDGYRVKVTQVTDDGAGTYTVSWQTYDERLYLDTLGSLKPRVLVSKLNDLAVYPSDVEDFNVIQSGNRLNFSWKATENVSYEIRQGDEWASAKVLGNKISDNYYSYEITKTGLYKFLIKSKNNYNYSKNATVDYIYIDYVPVKNIILDKNILSKNGLFYQTSLYQGVLKLKIQDKNWQNLIGVWNDVELEEYSLSGKWGAETYSSGYFLSEIFDLGKSFISFLELKYAYEGNVKFFFRYAKTLETLENIDFIEFKQGEYDFRYVQIKIILNKIENGFTNVKDVILQTDVPDKTAQYSIEITDAENGYLLDYSDVGFYSVPGIVATVTDSIYSYASTAEKTNSSARIYAIANNGEKTSAKADVQLFGY